MADTTYQPKVYHKVGSDIEVVASGGQIVGESGGSFDAQSGFTFYLGDDTAGLTSSKLRWTLYSLNTKTRWGDSGTGFSGTSIISPAYGYHFYSASTGISKASLQLPSAKTGAQLILDFSYCVLDANVSILIDSNATGFLSCYNYASIRLSSLEISAAGRVTFICFADDVWSIVSDNASVTERAAA